MPGRIVIGRHLAGRVVRIREVWYCRHVPFPSPVRYAAKAAGRGNFVQASMSPRSANRSASRVSTWLMSRSGRISMTTEWRPKMLSRPT